MNLAAYDIVKSKIDIRTWVNKDNKRIDSTEIPFYTYYYILKRYDIFCKKNMYYLAFTNTQTDTPKQRCVYSPRPGLVRINLYDIWFKSNLHKLEDKEEVTVRIVDEQEDCVIYKLDI